MTATLYILSMVLLSVPLLVLSAVAHVFITPFDKPRRVVHAISRFISRLFFSALPTWRTRREGMENIAPEQTYVVVLNHSSMIDIPMLYWTNLNFRWVTKRELLKMPIFGQYIYLHGDITIDRSASRRAVTKMETEGRKWLQRGVSVAIFPEGTRNSTGRGLQRFKTGAFALAKANGVAVLPVVLDGTGDLLHGFRAELHHTFTIKVLPPVSAGQVAESDVKELAETVQQQMSRALEQIRNEKTTLGR